MTRRVHVPAAIVVLVLGIAANVFHAAEAQASFTPSYCAQFTSCSDCACRQSGYTVADTCNTGCAWNSEGGYCDSANLARQTSQPGAFTYSLFAPATLHPSPVYSYEARIRVDIGDASFLCPVSTSTAAVATVASVIGVGVLLMAMNVVMWRRENSLRTLARVDDKQWLLELVRRSVPQGDVIMWEGTSRGAISGVGHAAFGNAIARSILAVSVTIPVWVWLGIGLPLTVEADWQFSFYFPIAFIAGALTLMSLLIFPIVHKQALAQTLVAGYVLTNRCAIIVAADPRRKAFGTHGALLVNNMEGGVRHIRRTDNGLTFTAVSAAGDGHTALAKELAAAADLKAQIAILRRQDRRERASAVARQWTAMQNSARRGVVTFVDVQDVEPAFQVLQAHVVETAVEAEDVELGGGGVLPPPDVEQAKVVATRIPTGAVVTVGDPANDLSQPILGHQHQPAGSYEPPAAL